MKEPILEPLLRKMRLAQVLPFLKKYPNCRLLDIGCGWEAKFLKAAEKYIDTGIGVDLNAPIISNKKIKTISMRLDKKLPFENGVFDFITMLAVMEHLEDDESILNECSRLLRPGGGLLITVPSWYAKPVLEFMSFKLNLINSDEIKDHKRYYDRKELFHLFSKVKGLEIIRHSYFQCRFNNRIFAIRKSKD